MFENSYSPDLVPAHLHICELFMKDIFIFNDGKAAVHQWHAQAKMLFEILNQIKANRAFKMFIEIVEILLSFFNKFNSLF